MTTPPLEHLTASEARAAWSQDPQQVVLLDCREAAELEIAAVAGATHIPMPEIVDRVAEIPRDKDVIIFCHSGIRSLSVAMYLRGEGYQRVRNMIGGIDAWSVEVDTTVPRY